MQTQTTCPDCGTRLKPLWSSWFCPKCADGDAGRDARPGPFTRRVPPTDRPNYFQRGHYTMRIDHVRIGSTRRGQFVEIGATVLKTHTDGDGIPADWHTPDEQVVSLLMAGNNAFMPRMKEFIAALSDLRPDEITMEMCDLVTGPKNPARGAVLDADNRLMLTKSGHEFMRINWKKTKTTP